MAVVVGELVTVVVTDDVGVEVAVVVWEVVGVVISQPANVESRKESMAALSTSVVASHCST